MVVHALLLVCLWMLPGYLEAPRHTLSPVEKAEDIAWLLDRVKESYAPLKSFSAPTSADA